MTEAGYIVNEMPIDKTTGVIKWPKEAIFDKPIPDLH
jgi:hypothetical protein